ncbi:hypothetical protein CCGE525_25630 (plasmid) [Rhizobium jaguaris]|uniref:Uncharacterized protein n=1 Tax=Rhizobium jaguaris TaxID=1312183 RepID=A0A387G200_9HYPH|nr:hypothetical protein CCGE525_25630 [Rhizobium jaguaris]
MLPGANDPDGQKFGDRIRDLLAACLKREASRIGEANFSSADVALAGFRVPGAGTRDRPVSRSQ